MLHYEGANHESQSEPQCFPHQSFKLPVGKPLDKSEWQSQCESQCESQRQPECKSQCK